MPYTFTHIGYIIPIKNKFLNKVSFSGLLFGSIAPDYDILFRITESRFHIFSYSLFDVFCLITPLAFISLMTFHIFCQKIVYNNLPEFFKKISHDWLNLDIKLYIKGNIFTILMSIIIAIYLHLFLDLLSHSLDAWSFKTIIYQLTNNLILGNISYYFALYGVPILFSIIGGILMLNPILANKPTIASLRLTKSQKKFWILIIACTILTTGIKIVFSTADIGFLIDKLLISSTGAFISSIYLICLMYKFLNPSKKISNE